MADALRRQSQQYVSKSGTIIIKSINSKIKVYYSVKKKEQVHINKSCTGRFMIFKLYCGGSGDDYRSKGKRPAVAFDAIIIFLLDVLKKEKVNFVC